LATKQKEAAALEVALTSLSLSLKKVREEEASAAEVVKSKEAAAAVAADAAASAAKKKDAAEVQAFTVKLQRDVRLSELAARAARAKAEIEEAISTFNDRMAAISPYNDKLEEHAGDTASAVSAAATESSDFCTEKCEGGNELQDLAAGAPDAPGDADSALPPGWTKQWSSSWQKHYWFNRKTDKQSWEHPGAEAAQAPGDAAKQEHAHLVRIKVPAEVAPAHGEARENVVERNHVLGQRVQAVANGLAEQLALGALAGGRKERALESALALQESKKLQLMRAMRAQATESSDFDAETCEGGNEMQDLAAGEQKRLRRERAAAWAASQGVAKGQDAAPAPEAAVQGNMQVQACERVPAPQAPYLSARARAASALLDRARAARKKMDSLTEATESSDFSTEKCEGGNELQDLAAGASDAPGDAAKDKLLALAETQFNLATVMRNMGKSTDASTLYTEAAAKYRTAVGPYHPQTRGAEALALSVSATSRWLQNAKSMPGPIRPVR